MTAYEIVIDYLEKNGYDGLFNKDYGCDCTLGDLCPCDQLVEGCRPGVLKDCGNGTFSCPSEIHIVEKE